MLSTVPLAERMLLYHVAMAAWIMLPERGLLQKSFSDPVFKGRGWGRVSQVRQPAPACRGSVPGPKKMGDPNFLLLGTH